MDYFFYICLFIFGSMLGSFGSVVIYRLKSGEGGISNGRSHCAKCNNILGALDLIPIVSWAANKAKCKYCKEKISGIYPILELSTGLLFSFIGYFLVDNSLIFTGNSLEYIKLFFWLSIGFITILYTFYDILFLEIHEGIMASGIGIILGGLIFQTISGYELIHTVPIIQNSFSDLYAGYFSIPLTLVIIGGLYTIMMKELSEWLDLMIIGLIILSLYLFKIILGINLTDITLLNGVIGALIAFIFFFTQIIISKGAWMGGGDLRIGIMVGLILGVSYSFSGLMLTYMVGSIIGVGFITHNKIKNKGIKFDSQIPFGPFLAIGFFITVFYSNELSNLIRIYL